MNLGRLLASAANRDDSDNVRAQPRGIKLVHATGCALGDDIDNGGFVVGASRQSTGLPSLQPLRTPDTEAKSRHPE